VKSRWEKAGDILGGVLQKQGIDETVRRHTALLGWEKVVGKRIAKRAYPLELRGKTLFVEVEGSAWIHELSFLKNDIVRGLNERAGADAIEQIVFTARGHGEESRTSRSERERPHG